MKTKDDKATIATAGVRQAIQTFYLGPTNTRGPRVCAKAQAGRIIVGWDDALDVNENHSRAAKAFADKWGWGGTWVGGGSPDGRGNVYVQVPAELRHPGEGGDHGSAHRPGATGCDEWKRACYAVA